MENINRFIELSKLRAKVNKAKAMFYTAAFMAEKARIRGKDNADVLEDRCEVLKQMLEIFVGEKEVQEIRETAARSANALETRFCFLTNEEDKKK